jgi:hypothetical protein
VVATENDANNQTDPADDQARDAEAKQRRERTVRIARRIGYVLFLGGGLALFVTLVVGVVQGISTNKVWDPYTSEPYYGAECLEDARHLIEDASTYERVVPPWENRYHRWVSRCKKRHPSVFQMLKQSRESIRRSGDRGEPAGSPTSENHQPSSDAGRTTEN